MDFKAVLLRAKEISEQMNSERPNRIGVAYDEREADRRADKLAYLRSHQKISFVDTHFHMDRLQRKTGLDRLDPIMICGPMPHIPSQLEAAITVFCDEGPTWDKLSVFEIIISVLPLVYIRNTRSMSINTAWEQSKTKY